jgi:hypothetical protein
MTDIQAIGVEFIRFLQSFHPSLDGVVSVLGNSVKPEYSIVFIVPLLFWNVNRELFFRLFLLMMADLALGEILRAFLAQPRPWWIADLLPLDPVTSIYSSPGGYSSFATIFYGYLALQIRRKWFTVLGVAMILLTGIAKMYDAAMLPDHMLAGVVQGLVLLFVFRKYENQLFGWLAKLSGKQVIGLSVAVVSFFFLMDALALYVQNSYELPASWAKYRMEPELRLAEGGIVYACGFLLGAMLSIQSVLKGDVKSNLSIKWKIVQSVVGLIVVIGVFLAGRNALLSVIDSLIIVAIVNVGLAALSGFWVFTICPRLFQRVASGAQLVTHSQQ